MQSIVKLIDITLWEWICFRVKLNCSMFVFFGGGHEETRCLTTTKENMKQELSAYFEEYHYKHVISYIIQFKCVMVYHCFR